MHTVKIVGAGIAGLSASLRLLERGFHVTLYEQDDFIGGMLRSHREEGDLLPREHSYHMLCNWYYNFWHIAKDLNIEKNFVPRESFKFLYKGHDGDKNMPELINPGGIQDFYRNLTGGAAPPAELFLFMYSMIDLLSIPDSEDDKLDDMSFNGWLRGRPYCTDDVADLHEKIWQTVWAIDSWQASARSYKTFLKYGNRVPVPQLWLFDGSKKDTLLDPFWKRLESFGERFVWEPLHRLEAIETCSQGNRIDGLKFAKVNISPSIHDDWKKVGKTVEVDTTDSNVIISMSPGNVAKLVTGELYRKDPALGQIRYLESEPMGSLELFLNRKLEDTPKEVVVMMDAKYQMTYLDYSHTWKLEKTFLYVTCSDYKSLLSAKREERDADGNLILDLQHPKTAIDYLLQQLVENVNISLSDIDLQRTHLETNPGEELFANLTGSWVHRPDVKTNYSNMFLAGTYVKNFADVATVEGACATGLMAAEGVRQAAKTQPEYGDVGTEIEVIKPEFYPHQMFQGLKVAWAPFAATAKAWSMADKALGINQVWPTADFKPPKWPWAPSPESLGSLFTDWMPRSKWDPKTMGLGPLYWNYDADGNPRNKSGR